MIPASYLYKDAYKQHWGQDFARVAGEEPWEQHLEAGHWQQPTLLRTIRDFVALTFGPKVAGTNSGRTATVQASVRPCPDCPAPA